MYRTFVRPLNDAERAQLETWINAQPPPPPPNGLWARLWGNDYDFRTKIYQWQERRKPIYREILADGHMIVHAVQPLGVVVHCQCEDEGDSYFFDIGEGRLFCVCCDEPTDPDEVWPNTDFEMALSRRHPEHFEMRTCHGVALEPVRVIEPNWNIWERLPKSSMCIIEGTLATVEQDLKRLANRERGIVEEAPPLTATAPNREMRYRFFSTDLIVAGCCTALFLTLAIVSIGLLRANDDGRLPGQKTIAIMLGIFWAVPVLLGVWSIATYFRTRLVVTADSITQRGCIQRKSIRTSEVNQLIWNHTPGVFGVVVHSPRTKISIELRNFAPPDRGELVAYFRDGFDPDIQVDRPVK